MTGIMDAPTANVPNGIKKSSPYKIEHCKSNCECTTFKAQVLDDRITIEVLKLGPSTFIWIGSAQTPTLTDLSLSIPNRNDKGNILQTKIIGTSEESLNLSQRLSRKLQKQVFVSLNVVSDVGLTAVPSIEKVIKHLIKVCPNCF